VHGNYREDGDVLCVCVSAATVVMYCHSRISVMARFLFRAQDRNMTIGARLVSISAAIFQHINVSQMAPSVKWKII